MMTEVQNQIRIIGCISKIESVDSFLSRVREFLLESHRDENILVQFMNADMVCGKEHVLSAVRHARRAFDRNESISGTMAMEIMIYAAGEPQIKNALAKMGIHKDSERMALVFHKDLKLDELMTRLKLQRDDGILDFNENKLRNFGFEQSEIEALNSNSLRDLVLERVAMVDVKK
jgi:KEOPS complex subunit Cgi121